MSRTRRTPQNPDRCPVKGCGERLHWTVDQIGRAVASCDGCARTRRGLCRDCPAAVPPGPLGHVPGRTVLRCPTCTAARTRKLHAAAKARRMADPKERQRYNGKQKQYLAQQRARRQAHAEVLRAQERERRAARVEEVRARDRARYAKERERRLEQSRAYHAANRERIMARKRAWYAARRDQILAEQRAWNAQKRAILDAAGAPREQRRRRAADPACQTCGAAIPYAGTGRPRAYCDAHRTYTPRALEALAA